MLRILGALAIGLTLLTIVFGIVTLYDETLQVGRMWETPAIRPHEQPMPVMSNKTVPRSGGELFYRIGNPDTMQPPFDLAQNDIIAAGKQGYQYFCVQCHGKHYDGYGTVGQSFAPPPGDLRSARVQNLPVGRFFHEISYGIPNGRQPALASTISSEDRWKIIAFVQSLAPAGQP